MALARLLPGVNNRPWEAINPADVCCSFEVPLEAVLEVEDDDPAVLVRRICPGDFPLELVVAATAMAAAAIATGDPKAGWAAAAESAASKTCPPDTRPVMETGTGATTDAVLICVAMMGRGVPLLLVLLLLLLLGKLGVTTEA